MDENEEFEAWLDVGFHDIRELDDEPVTVEEIALAQAVIDHEAAGGFNDDDWETILRED